MKYEADIDIVSDSEFIPLVGCKYTLCLNRVTTSDLLDKQPSHRDANSMK